MNKNKLIAKKVGERLKEKRQSRKLSLTSISEKLKIREKYLLALEEGRYEEFSSEVYIKGFLKNYAEFLGIDASIIMRLYRREQEKTESVNFTNGGKSKSRSGINLKLGPKKGATLFIASLIIGVLIYFLWNIFVYSQKPSLIITEPFQADVREASEFTFDTRNAEITLRGQIGTGNTLFMEESEIETFGLSEFEIPNIDLPIGEKRLELKTRNQFGAQSELLLKIIRSEDSSSFEEGAEEDIEVDEANEKNEIDSSITASP